MSFSIFVSSLNNLYPPWYHDLSRGNLLFPFCLTRGDVKQKNRAKCLMFDADQTSWKLSDTHCYYMKPRHLSFSTYNSTTKRTEFIWTEVTHWSTGTMGWQSTLCTLRVSEITCKSTWCVCLFLLLFSLKTFHVCYTCLYTCTSHEIASSFDEDLCEKSNKQFLAQQKRLFKGNAWKANKCGRCVQMPHAPVSPTM